MTALEPLVSAYVEFGDLEIAKKLFQIIRKQNNEVQFQTVEIKKE